MLAVEVDKDPYDTIHHLCPVVGSKTIFNKANSHAPVPVLSKNNCISSSATIASVLELSVSSPVVEAVTEIAMFPAALFILVATVEVPEFVLAAIRMNKSDSVPPILTFRVVFGWLFRVEVMAPIPIGPYLSVVNDIPPPDPKATFAIIFYLNLTFPSPCA